MSVAEVVEKLFCDCRQTAFYINVASRTLLGVFLSNPILGTNWKGFVGEETTGEFPMMPKGEVFRTSNHNQTLKKFHHVRNADCKSSNVVNNLRILGII